MICLEVNLNDAFKDSIKVIDGKKVLVLDDLSGEHIYQNKNKGTTNLKINVSKMKEVKYNNTHTVSLKKRKDQQTVFVGYGRDFSNDSTNQGVSNEDIVTDLGF